MSSPVPPDNGDVQASELVEPRARPRWRTPALWNRRRWLATLLVVFMVGAVPTAVAIESTSPSGPVVGALSEPVHELPDGFATVAMSDASKMWGLGDVAGEGSGDSLGGGAALGDVDGDGDLDLVVANGSALLFAWEGEGFAPAVDLGVDDAVAVAVGDIDGDQWVDVAIARAAPTDVILWGSEQDLGDERSELKGAEPSAALMIGEVSGDDRVDLVRLGRGEGTEASDVIWTATGERREFNPVALPVTGRLSLAGELADIDGDGLVDIWVTRDVGWDQGGDSLYSRRGDADGPWVDVAAEMGTDLEVDGMGVTLADLNADGVLDAYVSDIGDNELLLGRGGWFEPEAGSGAARIRPPGTGSDVVSSSWGSAATDLNLDGNTDLVVVGGGFPDGGVRNKIDGTSVAMTEPPALFVGLGGGRFVDVWPTLDIDVEVTGRGLTAGDVDGDGDTDLVVVATDGSILALRNDSLRPSLTVRGDGCRAGTVVTVRSGDTLSQQLLRPHSYAGQHDAEVIVGLDGPDISVEVKPPGQKVITRDLEVSEDREGREVLEVDCD